jgi:hypothetical protein
VKAFEYTYVQSFRAADYDTDHYLVVANVTERIAVNKQRSHRFHMEVFNLKKLNEVEGKDKLCFGVSNSFQLWKTYILGGGGLIVLGKQLEKI